MTPQGGRVWTYTDLGFPTDLGASWIHGASSGNPLTPFVTEFNLRTKDDPDEQNCRTFGSIRTEGGKLGETLSVFFSVVGGLIFVAFRIGLFLGTTVETQHLNLGGGPMVGAWRL